MSTMDATTPPQAEYKNVLIHIYRKDDLDEALEKRFLWSIRDEPRSDLRVVLHGNMTVKGLPKRIAAWSTERGKFAQGVSNWDGPEITFAECESLLMAPCKCTTERYYSGYPQWGNWATVKNGVVTTTATTTITSDQMLSSYRS